LHAQGDRLLHAPGSRGRILRGALRGQGSVREGAQGGARLDLARSGSGPKRGSTPRRAAPWRRAPARGNPARRSLAFPRRQARRRGRSRRGLTCACPAAQNHAACEKERIPVTFLPDERAWGPGSEAAFAAHEAVFLVDALLGTGSKGAPRGAVGAAIEMAEHTERPIASIDIPSGLDASSGYVELPAIRAEFTVTLQLLKRGLKLEPGRSHAGQVEVVDI